MYVHVRMRTCRPTSAKCGSTIFCLSHLSLTFWSAIFFRDILSAVVLSSHHCYACKHVYLHVCACVSCARAHTHTPTHTMYTGLLFLAITSFVILLVHSPTEVEPFPKD